MEKKWEEIYSLLSAGSYPSEYDKAQRQNLRRYASKFKLNDGELFFGTRRVVKTKDDARRIFHEFHSCPIRGHTGTQKTLAAVCSGFYWFSMTVDIKNWILECDQCQKDGKPLAAVQPLQCIKRPRSGTNEGGRRKKLAPAGRARSADRKMAAQEKFFAGIPKIQYKPDAGPGDVMCFKHYNAEEVLMGRTMEDWLRFSVCYWHSFCGPGAGPFGVPTHHRLWNKGSPMKSARKRLCAAFEFFTKLGVKYYTFHDRDIAPEGSTLEESNRNLDEITDLALKLQNQTGVKLLWITCNLFTHLRYMNGAATNPDCHVLAYAGTQVKKSLEIAKKLGAENFVFWGGRGFHSIHNTDVAVELNHMAIFFKMAVNYKEKIGLSCQFLIAPQQKEPSKHQYDYDAMSLIGFLKHFGLDSDFKLKIEPNHTTLGGHDIVMASAFGMLGSIDSNTGYPYLGWDTDQCPLDIRNTTLVMKVIVEQGGLHPGGLNFVAKAHRESTDLEDLFISHIGVMDAFARGLRNAVHIIEDGVIASMMQERYSSFSHGLGQKVENGTATLEEMEDFIKQNGEPEVTSGKQEKYESVFNHYI
ncbi:xylose isomerase-like [Neolamprologus brichardi]|uniref:xylose isomerase-like n=1 Tax=Neolamprologus brichardi TaxID=32507 RepID=UPI0003EC0C82|nr:xylose isomerase-like [Neolamprologus brichardi]